MLWIFHREDLPQSLDLATDLSGLRIGVGELGSGTYTSAIQFLDLNGINESNSTLVIAPSDEGAEMLKAGELDALMVVAGLPSPLVQELSTTPHIDILSITRAKAYTSNRKNLSSVELVEGALDIRQNIPDEDKQLLAVTATLVANDGLHPDLARLLIIIATEIHNPGGVLENSGEFPASIYTGIPMSRDATLFLERGPTSLERVLPLWMASRLERLLFLLIPAILVLYPVLRGAPSAVAYFFRYRVKRRYKYLREVEERYRTYSLNELDDAIARLESFQLELHEKVSVPASMLDEYYELRMHTSLTLDRLRTQRMQLIKKDQPNT